MSKSHAHEPACLPACPVRSELQLAREDKRSDKILRRKAEGGRQENAKSKPGGNHHSQRLLFVFPTHTHQREMPLNSTTYLTTQGWEGVGVPLDGVGGKGLKKPLAMPAKRGLKGLGKERDRAVEWWDCLFEVSSLESGKESNSGLISLQSLSGKRKDAQVRSPWLFIIGSNFVCCNTASFWQYHASLSRECHCKASSRSSSHGSEYALCCCIGQ